MPSYARPPFLFYITNVGIYITFSINFFCHVTVVQYQIEISTGDDDNAGTESNVYMTLYGERGDTGMRTMRIQGQEKVTFTKDATQTFTLEAVSLGALSKCIVGHDGKEPGKVFLKKYNDVILLSQVKTQYMQI